MRYIYQMTTIAESKMRNKSIKAIETATKPSEVYEALKDIRERTRKVKETNRRRLWKYGRKINTKRQNFYLV